MPFGTVTLNDGNQFPTIAFGTGSTMKFRDVTDYVGQAIESGFSHIDTAQYYQTETYVGLAIKESGLPRSSLYITTKYSATGTPRQAIQQSLNKIGLSYVDMYMVHMPLALPDLESGWQEFEKMKKDGLARSIGVSNFAIEDLQKLLKTAVTKPTVNQVNSSRHLPSSQPTSFIMQIKFHPYNYASHKALIEYCVKQNIIVEAYGSLNSITQNPGGPVDAVVNAAAKRIGATPNQVIFSWVRSKGVAIVTTSRTKERLQEYLAVEDLPPLTYEEIAAIDEAGAKGPPSRLLVARLAMQHELFEKAPLLCVGLAVAVMFGLIKFFVFWGCTGVIQ
ncbi:NADP-dependent oxidoreductase domain-containing protein [Suillus clintonianus]|uniref:NADP-dependent oxidoreductase domain-containing protein n=1 Tax=Suillus clintonianus TaxID=1904413 RepID=UPI001B870749|nr:NADP-dependent oxidoreductase domain-containing protein [Suillus clintonianus]KAG2151432.1 NADP-dependent oxidoreductase domain-containing protein [Suillus clintonianus]